MAAPSIYPAKTQRVYLIEFRTPEIADIVRERVTAGGANAAIAKVMARHGFDIDVVNVTVT